ncbi:MAG: hypothetical protein ACLFMV_07355, partial [Spirochaetaceae bacterium]
VEPEAAEPETAEKASEAEPATEGMSAVEPVDMEPTDAESVEGAGESPAETGQAPSNEELLRDLHEIREEWEEVAPSPEPLPEGEPEEGQFQESEPRGEVESGKDTTAPGGEAPETTGTTETVKPAAEAQMSAGQEVPEEPGEEPAEPEELEELEVPEEPGEEPAEPEEPEELEELEVPEEPGEEPAELEELEELEEEPGELEELDEFEETSASAEEQPEPEGELRAAPEQDQADEAVEPLEELEGFEELEELEAAASGDEAESGDETEPDVLEPTESSTIYPVRMSDWFSFSRTHNVVGEEEDVEEAELIEEFDSAEEESYAGFEEEAESGEPYRMEENLIVVTSSAENDNECFELLPLSTLVATDAGEEQGTTATEAPFVTDSEGVVRIDSRVFSREGSGEDEEVRSLVDSVTGESEGHDREEAPQENQSEAVPGEATGIDDLFGPGAGLDLLPVGGGGAESSEEPESPPGRAVPDLGPRGLEYDQVLAAYPDSEGGTFKSLVQFSRAWAARAAGILVPHDDAFHLEYSLAFEEGCRRSFMLPMKSDVYHNVMRHRSLLLTREPLHRFKAFHGLCSESAFAYIGSVLLLPIVFRRQEAYMLLAVSEKAGGIRELLAKAGLSLFEAAR